METVNLYNMLDNCQVLSGSKGIDAPSSLRQHLIRKLNNGDIVCIDLSNLKSLSPSFAYEAFGKLVDEFGAEAENRLQYTVLFQWPVR